MIKPPPPQVLHERAESALKFLKTKLNPPVPDTPDLGTGEAARPRDSDKELSDGVIELIELTKRLKRRTTQGP